MNNEVTEDVAEAGILFPTHRSLRKEMGRGYRLAKEAARAVGAREGCKFVRSAGRQLLTDGDDGVGNESWSWDGTRRDLVEEIRALVENPRVKLVFVQVWFDAHEFIDSDGYDVTQAACYTLDLWARPGSAEAERYEKVTPTAGIEKQG